MEINKLIEEYLNYYVSLEVPPNYAVLLTGNWGCGKSWFLKNYIKNHKNNKDKYLYVSLYGITSYDEIETAFFKELNPFLASEGMKMASAIFKGIIKSTIKIDFDFDGDSKSDGSSSMQMPDVKLLKTFKEVKNCILIFDDLERSSLPILNVLGYINQFVENENIKAIIIANEDELLKKDKDSKGTDSSDQYSYRKIKEKLIGKTFEIQTDVDSSIKDFINQLRNSEVKSLLIANVNYLKGVFKASGYNNLRHLRQAILDFERFYEFLPKSSLTKKALVENILDVFFALNFELKKGEISNEDINIIAHGFTLLDSRRKNKDDITAKIIRKYNGFNNLNPIKAELWHEYFKTSFVDKEKIKSQIYSSIYYNDETTPNWKKLGEYFLLEDDQFIELSNSVLMDFMSYKYSNKEILVYVVSMLLFFADKKLIDYTKEEIAEIAEENIAVLKKCGALDVKANQNFTVDLNFNFNIFGKDLKEFSDFYDKLKFEAESTKEDNLKSTAGDLLKLLNESFEDFEKVLLVNVYGQSLFHETPILKYIDIDQFVDVFWELPQLTKRYLGRVFVDRYNYRDLNKKIKVEIDWLKSIHQRIKAENDISENRLTKYLVEDGFLSQLSVAIAKIEQDEIFD